MFDIKQKTEMGKKTFQHHDIVGWTIVARAKAGENMCVNVVRCRSELTHKKLAKLLLRV